MENSADRLVEGVLGLPIPVELESAVAGSVTAAQIGGLVFDILMPEVRLANDDSGHRLVAPTMHSVDGETAAKLDWGTVTEWREGGETAEDILKVDIERVLLRHRLPEANEEKAALDVLENVRQAMLKDIDRWTTSLVTWLEVGSGEPLKSVQVEAERPAHHLRAWGHNGAEYVRLSGPGLTLVSAVINESIPLDTWQRAVHRASIGDTPPTEYTLLIAAHRNLRNGDLRRAVLDAATGAEMALTRMLDAHLASTPAVIAELVRDKWGQIRNLKQALKRLGVSLPSGIDGQALATPRNAAIHRGTEPTREQAVSSIDVASQVIEMAVPLDSIF